jgi:hypothetical protein
VVSKVPDGFGFTPETRISISYFCPANFCPFGCGKEWLVRRMTMASDDVMINNRESLDVDLKADISAKGGKERARQDGETSER